MGIRGLSTFLNSLRTVEKIKRENRFEATPNALAENISDSTTLASAMNFQSSSSKTSLSTQLSQALTFSNFQSSDTQARNYSTKGIGLRDFEASNAPVLSTESLFRGQENPNPADLTLVNFSEDPNQSDATQIRSAIFEISKEYLLVNPQSSTDELKDKIDSVLGEGVSDIFNIRIEDLGAGYSAVQADQVETNDLSEVDKDALKAAAVEARENYQTVSVDHALQGDDVNTILNDIQSLLGVQGVDLFEDLKISLSQIGNTSDALAQAEKTAIQINLPKDDQAKLKNLFDQLKNVDQQTMNSFDENILSDDFSMKFASGRYGLAFGSADIAAMAALTDNAEWLSQSGMTIPKKS
ncbi:MAG: hypothetical protein J0L93_10890 [Deltaproteobacteria bacterium]|nr:hypothetical protein [Deltaproteobacteria bacterium]